MKKSMVFQNRALITKELYNDEPSFNLTLKNIFVIPQEVSAFRDNMIVGPTDNALNAQLSAIF